MRRRFSPMRFLTLTANLLAEYTFEFPTWAPGRTQRARSEFFQVGGKGVNVAKMLRRLGAEAEAIVFPGGETGRQCIAFLKALGLPYRAYAFEQPATRVGVAVRAPEIEETTFLGCDRALPESAVAACAADLEREPPDTVLALCGSVPGWETPGGQTLAAALGHWIEKGRRLVVDTYGPPLAWLVDRPVQLVKINRKEFDGLIPPQRDGDFAERLRTTAAARSAATWIVSDGPRAVWWCERGGEPANLAPPAVQEVSPTGSGDVLHAAVLDAWLRRMRPVAEALAFALPLAAANAAHPGVADFPLNLAPENRSQ